ncbi:MAG: 3-oxoacyl-ACP reductase FabG [Bdellovibrionales bacterium]|nr:3-oxoacyl-ACP reductase FabG [Bdellovibrionales bacterium]
MTNIQYKFNEKKAVVTGGAQGIGFEIARQFLTSGATVAIWDYSQEGLDMAGKELSEFSDRLTLQQVNVGDRTSVEAATQALPWSVDILVNNAGITRDKSFTKMTGEEWDAVIQTNLTGLFNVTKSLLDKFTDSDNKRIINMASVVSLYGNFGQTNYAAAKAGVVGMTKTWAKELGRKGFTCNAVAPGFTLTKMVQAMPTEVLEGMEKKVPVQRLGKTEDIANACLFLSADESSYINGTVISVDGGIVL